MAKVLFFIILIMLITTDISTALGRNIEQGGCSCGVFPENSSTPLIVQSLQYNVSCDKEGLETCQNLCIALAQSARDQAPALICEKLNIRVENLMVGVFTKTSCNIKDEWDFTGLKSPEPICCDGGKNTICNPEINLSLIA